MAGVDLGPKGQELRQRYIESLPARLEELHASWHWLQHVSWDSKSLTTMAQCAHKLYGSGTTFQFPDISHSAQILEDHLQKVLNKPDVTVDERHTIETSLDNLEGAIEKAIHTATPIQAVTTVRAATKSHHRIAVIEDDRNQSDFLQSWLEQ
ncbi:MAG: Hpt domain-containing protein, partial [Marinobacter sp.]